MEEFFEDLKTDEFRNKIKDYVDQNSKVLIHTLRIFNT